MDVIPYACSIRGGPVTAEYLQLWSEANGHLAHKGEKVVGNPVGILTDPSGGVGPNRVEITQACDSPSVWCAGLQVGQHLLYCRLGMAVRVNRCNRSGFRDGNGVGVAVDGCAAAEHQGVATMGLHGLKQIAAAIHVDVPVVQRLPHGLPTAFRPAKWMTASMEDWAFAKA